MKKIFFLLAVTVVLTACANNNSNNGSVANAAPTFTVQDTKDISYSLSDYKGGKVYIKFWASWCPICLSGLEDVDSLSTSNENFTVLSVVSPNYNNEKKTASFIKWINGVEEVKNLPVLLDEDGVLAKQYGIQGYPTSVFIDSTGALVQTVTGHLTNDQIKERFETIR